MLHYGGVLLPVLRRAAVFVRRRHDVWPGLLREVVFPCPARLPPGGVFSAKELPMIRVLCGLALAAVVGCTGASSAPAPVAAKPSEADEVAAERAKLSAEDRKLVDAQEWCVVSTGERLGGMGEPIKLTVKDETVFLCCGGCKTKALADPDKTLAQLAANKKKKAGG